MPRKRMIDPSFWRDEKIAKCSFMERLLFQGLWTFAEDHGVGRANPLLIKADIFPYDPLREADIQTSLEKLSSLGVILLYERDGQRYYYVVNFTKHQTINKPSKTTLPPPDEKDYHTTTVVTTEIVTSEDKLSKEKLKEKESMLARFNLFWDTYPRKAAKKKAEAVFLKLNVDDLLLQKMLSAIASQKKEWSDPKFIPHPTTWLNQVRWEDEVAITRSNIGFGQRKYTDEEKEQRKKDAFADMEELANG